MTATSSQIASRTAAELLPSQTAYLGPGLPRLIADHLAPGGGVLLLDAENLLAPPSGAGACILEQSDAAGFVRGGYLDVAVLQARQVSISGDLSEPTTVVPGPTRSAEMGLHARRVVAVVELDGGTGAIVEGCESAAVRRLRRHPTAGGGGLRNPARCTRDGVLRTRSRASQQGVLLGG